ncbi:MAG: hypothetical protein WAK11_08825 [Candidatus Cybelea sp.]
MSKALQNEMMAMIREGKSESEIRAAIEPRLAAGCKLTTYTDTCVTNSGTSGYKQCGYISGCDDPSNNTDAECGACQGS